MMKTVLIIGGSGFLGTHLALKLREGYKVFATYDSHVIRIPGVSAIPVRLANRSAGKQIMALARPDVIIYAAGSNDADWAERFAKDAEKVHTAAVGGVAMASSSSKMIFLSNGHVFDGRRGNYHEQDVVLPSSMLGKCKLGGENFVRGKALNYIVLRTSPILGRGNGIRMTWLDELRIKLGRGERITIPNDELYNFAPVRAFVDLMVSLIEAGPRNKIFHYGGLTKVTPYDVGRQFAQRFGFDPGLVVPGQSRRRTVSRLDDSESRVRDYSLNATQLVETLKVKPLLLEESFDLIEKELVPSL